MLENRSGIRMIAEQAFMKFRFRKEKILIIVILLAACIHAESIDSIIAKARSGKAKPEFSISFNRMDNGDVLYSHNSHTKMKPASNLKILTTAAALKILGEDFEYITRYGMVGNDLVIIGSGDPLTGDPVVAESKGIDIFDIFRNVYNKLNSEGITEIEGDLVVDSFIFDDDRFHSSWPESQANRWYEAQIAGLNFNDNCVDILFSPSVPGQAADYKLFPDTSYLQIENKCKTTGSGKTAVGATRKLDTNEVMLIGKCKTALEVPIYVTVDRPAAYHGFLLAEYLLKYGISVKGNLVIRQVTDKAGNLPGGFQELYAKRTSLVDVVNECNRRSLNMAAECVFKTIGVYSEPDFLEVRAKRERHRPGSWANGRAAVVGYLENIGVSESEYVIDDGCGLSHDNRLSANALCHILLDISRSKHYNTFRGSLASPAAGTLAKKRRFSGLDGRIYAKTGYISGANTLSGYCQSDSGTWLVFSVLTNSPASSNSIIDKIVKTAMKSY